MTYRPRGLQLLDLEAGTAEKLVMKDHQIDRIVPASDWSSLYLIGPTKPGRFGTGEPLGTMVRQVDPITLETQAERSFNGPITLLVE
jgi:hypothetical protein